MLGGKLDLWCNRGKNDFLGTAYIAVGAICMALALVRPNTDIPNQNLEFV
jgi:hypothetical protein